MKEIMKNIKSTLVKLLAAVAIAFVAVVSVQTFTSNNSATQTVQAARKLSKREKAAKRWIAMRESSGSYTARNGACYGKYQLNIAYLHGDLSPKNQERTADNYVYGRYGSWVNAKRFWLAHHWY
ncbi:peptidoglycan-binding protein [Lactobacillus hamsteri DSM 5661 = JCM 6256]|uniref:Peptidoglycan-binding protein n=1 Tax=Lactobacillus hamsteri DSM 5661 = JCM 6256 TaxID=1423754 RepID=A0A0R1Y9U5_9LACO|nr:peptidoglycan-binding protein [Lactobacillus hamsteri DSM 5661 = JCM 6256]